jgi:hypothetical protein
MKSFLRCALAVLTTACLLFALPANAIGLTAEQQTLADACLPARSAATPTFNAADYLIPGRYWNQPNGAHKGMPGHGWDFFWYRDDGTPATGANPGDKLYVVWYTYEK